MFEHAIYAMLSPEGFASILFKDAKRADEAAALLGLTPQELLTAHVVDRVIPEMDNHTAFYEQLRLDLKNEIADLQKLSTTELIAQRQQRFAQFS